MAAAILLVIIIVVVVVVVVVICFFKVRFSSVIIKLHFVYLLGRIFEGW